MKKIDFILVLEKDTIFHYLRDLGFSDMLVSGRGQTDLCTRVLLKKLRDHFKRIPFYCLVDANLSGAYIFSTYRFGSEDKAYDSLCLTVPNLEYIGLDIQDVPEENLKCMEAKDLKLAENLLKKTYVSSLVNLRTNLINVQDNGKKAHIEMIMSEHNLEDYIIEKMKCIYARLKD